MCSVFKNNALGLIGKSKFNHFQVRYWCIKMGNVRHSFTARKKLKVIAYAEAHGNRAAGRQFSINEANVRLWRHQRDRLQQLPKTKVEERGRSALFPNKEAELLNWVTERRYRDMVFLLLRSTSELLRSPRRTLRHDTSKHRRIGVTSS